MSPDGPRSGIGLRSALGEPLVGIAICFAAGIALNHLFAPGLAISYGAAALALVAWIHRDRTLALWMVCLTAGSLLHFLQTGADRSAPLFDQIQIAPLTVTVEGVVVSAPTPTTASIPSRRFDLQLRQVSNSGNTHAVHGNVVSVNLRGIKPLAYGDLVRIEGTLRQPHPRRNPAAFDYAAYLRHRGIHAEFLATDDSLEVLSGNNANRLVALGLRGRAWVSSQLTRGLGDHSKEQQSLILAMTLGAKDDTPTYIEDKFRYSGTLHVFAVSGLHVGIVAAVTWFFATMIAPLLRAPRKLAILATIAAVLGYALVTGLRPSAVRAAVMATIYFGGMLFDREPQIFNSTGAAALTILLFDTGQLFRPGFQLSFCVLLCIAAMATPVSSRLARPFQRDPFFPNSLVTPPMRLFHTSTRKAAGLIGMSVAAWIGSLLLTWYYFGLLTPVSIFANLVLIPLAFVILATAAFSVALALIPHPLPAELANEANAFWTGVAAESAGSFSELPGAHLTVPAPNHLFRAPCEINVLDLPYGGASVHIAFKGGADWLIDTGSDLNFGNKTHPLLRSYAAGSLDGLVLTHADVSHVGGAATAIDEYRPERVITTPHDSTSRPWRNALVAAEHAGIDVERPAAGTTIELDRGHRLNVIYPPIENAPGFVADDRTLVLRLDPADGWRVLLVTDAGFYTDRWLADNLPASELRCDVLIRGAHESDDSTLPGLIAMAQPKAIVLSSQSSRTRTSLPPRWVADRRSEGIEVFAQNETGAVTMRFHEDRAELRAFLGDQSISLKRAD